MINSLQFMLRDLSHWLSQWIVYCPFLMLSSTRREEERRAVKNGFWTKVLVAFAIQITTMTVSVVGGSYITMQLIQYKIITMAQDERDIRSRQDALTSRVTANEKDIAGIKARNQIIDQASIRGGAHR
jgi:hypothetical protein